MGISGTQIKNENDLDTHFNKTKTMIINKDNNKPVLKITHNGMTLEQINSFSYLKQLIIDDDLCEREISKRIGLTKNNVQHYETTSHI